MLRASVINYLLSKANREAGSHCQATAYIPQEKPLQKYWQLVPEYRRTLAIVTRRASDQIIAQSFEKRVEKVTLMLDLGLLYLKLIILCYSQVCKLGRLCFSPSLLLVRGRQKRRQQKWWKMTPWLRLWIGENEKEKERSCIEPITFWGLQNCPQCYKTLNSWYL